MNIENNFKILTLIHNPKVFRVNVIRSAHKFDFRNSFFVVRDSAQWLLFYALTIDIYGAFSVVKDLLSGLLVWTNLLLEIFRNMYLGYSWAWEFLTVIWKSTFNSYKSGG